MLLEQKFEREERAHERTQFKMAQMRKLQEQALGMMSAAEGKVARSESELATSPHRGKLYSEIRRAKSAAQLAERRLTSVHRDILGH